MKDGARIKQFQDNQNRVETLKYTRSRPWRLLQQNGNQPQAKVLTVYAVLPPILRLFRRKH